MAESWSALPPLAAPPIVCEVLTNLPEQQRQCHPHQRGPEENEPGSMSGQGLPNQQRENGQADSSDGSTCGRHAYCFRRALFGIESQSRFSLDFMFFD